MTQYDKQQPFAVLHVQYQQNYKDSEKGKYQLLNYKLEKLKPLTLFDGRLNMKFTRCLAITPFIIPNV